MNEKIRLDLILKEKFGLSREQAKEAVINGYVSSKNKIFKKPGEKIFFNTDINVDEKGFLKYVGRGGLKLEKAIEEFNINILDKVCIDVGASTGGFTDCMLQYGAKKIFSVDVGTGQLSDIIKNNPKVISMENTNIVRLLKSDFSDEIDFASIDVSFVSLTKILPFVENILKDNGEAVALIKPQFEAGRNNISKKGIVKNPKVHKNIIKSVFVCALEIGFKIKNLSFSPIKGSEGNIEYVIYLSKNIGETKSVYFNDIIEKTVFDAQRTL